MRLEFVFGNIGWEIGIDSGKSAKYNTISINIWKETPDYPMDYSGLMVKYAREHGNTISRDEAMSYVEMHGLGTPAQTVSLILNRSGKMLFLQYAENQFVLTEAINANLSIPSYMRDWLVMKFSDSQGIIDYDSILAYVKKFIPDRDAFQVIKYQLMQGGIEKFLARVRMDVNLKKNCVQFELPDFGGSRGGASGIVSNEVLEQYADVLLRESENWGIVELALGSTLDIGDELDFGSSDFLANLFGKSKSKDSYAARLGKRTA